MKKQVFNPYLPSWEYIPDGEPHVFENRVYVYGSHDKFNGYVFCMGNYVCWSAPIDDLSDWRCEGEIYKKTDDPLNPDGRMCLYAPDVTIGPDGRYYIYYALDKVPIISVAVCDTPAGKYEFYGYVHHSDGTRLGEGPNDEVQFDPGVITVTPTEFPAVGKTTYLYTGFCGHGDKSRSGAMATELGEDMLTITKAPVIIVPGNCYGKGTEYEGHEYFEAASIRKIGDTYYFIYSSSKMHELCYATSKHPLKDFKYGGVIVSNCDKNIDTYKPAHKPMNIYDENNHGSIVNINNRWFIFYHRHTNGTWFSRQGCAEEIKIEADGSIKQVEITSCGLNGKPLCGKGEYPAFIACNLFRLDDNSSVTLPFISQDGKDGDEEPGFVKNISDSTGVGFKYFECKDITNVKIKCRGYSSGFFEVKTSYNGEALGKIPVEFTNIWTDFSANITIPDGVHALYFIYKGIGDATLGSFTLS